MASIKTAISIQKALYEQVDQMARELNVSRSRIFVMAVEEFIQRYQNQQLLQQINQAYDDMPPAEEQVYLDKMRQQHRQVVNREW
ncbi:MAG: ribbon-helix-helix protein, CopG family [Chloroflexi bacterium]|nr:MAG: ribbon-helix-helix protein, CopG family [Chloroflexota bacterium]